MDISTLQRLHRMGILSTGQARHFAMGGLYEEGDPPINLDKLIVSGPKAPSLRTQLGGVVPDNIDNYPMEDLQNNPIGNLATRPSGLDQNALAGYFNRQLPEGWTPPKDFMQTPWNSDDINISANRTWTMKQAYLDEKDQWIKGASEDENWTDDKTISRELLKTNPEEYFKKAYANDTHLRPGISDQPEYFNNNPVHANDYEWSPMTSTGSQYSMETQATSSLPANMQPVDMTAPLKRTNPATALSQPGSGALFPPQSSPWETSPSMLGIPSTTTAENPATPITESNTKSFGNDYDAYLADAKKYQGKYRDAQSIEDVYKEGNISKEERDRLQLLSPEDLQKQTNPTQGIGQSANQDKPSNISRFPYMSPLGTDFTSNMFQAGRAISAPKGTPGRGLGIGLNIGAGLLEAARGIGSGMAYQNMNDQARNYYDDQMRKRLYTNAPQTQNANITGGVSEGRYGGLFQNNHFALGGEQMMQEQMAQEQMSQEEMPQEEQAMAQDQVAPQAKIQKIAEQLVAGLGSLEAIDAYLKEQQVDEATYNAIMQVAQQMIEGQNQSQPAMEEAPMEEAPTMRGGGKFKHRVGDKIEFTHKGKKHRGVIKKIENGQIYL